VPAHVGDRSGRSSIVGMPTDPAVGDASGDVDDHADPLMEAWRPAGAWPVCPNPVVDLAPTRISAGRNRR
jgi:hypothetical protein